MAQAFFLVSLIKGQRHLLTSEDARMQCGVDHPAYATLANDIEAAPGLFEENTG